METKEQQAQQPTVGNQDFNSQSMIERQTDGAQDYMIDSDALEKARQTDLATKKQAEAKEKPEEDSKERPEPAAKEEPEKQQEKKPEAEPEKEGEEEESPLDAMPKFKKRAQDWDDLKSKHEQEKADLKRQIEEARGDERLQKLEEELEQYKELLKESSIEKDPEFNKKFDTEKNAYAKQIKTIVGDHSEQIDRILSLPNSDLRREKLEQIGEELSDRDKARIGIMMDQIDGIDIRRQAEIEVKKASWEENQSKAMKAEESRRNALKSEINTTLERTLKDWKSEDQGHFLFQDDGSKETKKAIESAEGYAKNWLKSVTDGTIKPSDLAKSALHLSAIPRFKEFVSSVVQERDEYKAQVEKFYKAKPGDASKAGESTGGKDFKSPTDDGYTDHFIAALENAQKQ